MVYRRKRLSFGARALFALLSLRVVAAFSTPSHSCTRMDQHHFVASSQSTFHRRKSASLLVSAAKADDNDDLESLTVPFRHSRRHRRRLIDLAIAIDESESIEPSLETPAVVALLSNLFGRYSDLLERRPFITNGITAGLLAATGDLVAQSESIHVAQAVMAVTIPFNWARTLTFLLTSLLYEGPWIYIWYEGLWKMGRWMESTYQAGPRLQVAAQIFVDQSIGVFIYFPLYFMVYECIGAVLSGRGTR
jgi:hypothetical protein